MTSPTAAYVDATGLHAPSFAAVLDYLKASYRAIYGQDIPFDNSDQDTQWITLIAAAINDANAMAAQVYNSFSPLTAQGVGLSSVVKVNGIVRDGASYSTVDVVCVGQAGRVVTGPKITDPGGNAWTMADFAFPSSGAITVTATCSVLGAVAAPAGTAWAIATPQIGWQSVSNPTADTPGSPVETDPQLRVRQAQSVALPSQTVLDGITADILSLDGVARVRAYENDTDVTDANGSPAHGTAFVVDGGDAQSIAQAIALKKTQGSPTYGTATQTVLTGKAQIPRDIRFFRPVEPLVTYNVIVETMPGYTLDTRAAIRQALADWTSALGIGTSVSINDAYGPVLGVTIGGARPFKVTSIKAARDGAVPQAADVHIAFYEAALGLPANVNVAEVAAS